MGIASQKVRGLPPYTKHISGEIRGGEEGDSLKNTVVTEPCIIDWAPGGRVKKRQVMPTSRPDLMYTPPGRRGAGASRLPPRPGRSSSTSPG